jgi:hypothetical protein
LSIEITLICYRKKKIHHLPINPSIMVQTPKPITTNDFHTRKARQSTALSQNPDSVRVREWSRLQTGLDAAIQNINNRNRQRKYRALNHVRATATYQKASAQGKDEAESAAVEELEAIRTKELDEARALWAEINEGGDYLEDNEGEDTPDEDEDDCSDPEFEVPDEISAAEAVGHVYDEQDNPLVPQALHQEWDAILKRNAARDASFQNRVEALGQEDETGWSEGEGEEWGTGDEVGSDSEKMDVDSSDSGNWDDESEWDGIPDE